MKAFILYQPASEFARTVEEYAVEFKRVTGQEIDLEDIHSLDGSSAAKLYDIMQHPCVMITRDDGQLVQHWEGMPLPMINEVLGFMSI